MPGLHPRLARDCTFIGSFPLSRLLLMRDANYPWFILVPDREGVTEIHELEDADQVRLIRESSCLASLLAKCFAADKINIGALGNLVPQLHIHHVVRYRDDPAWPAPVWGRVPLVPYTPAREADVIERIGAALPADFRFADRATHPA